jgi:hypothetical protein
VPLVCLKCSTPVPAEPDEVAWVCSQCGQGLLLDVEKGLEPLIVQYAAGIPAGARGKPFWVVDVQVILQGRETYSMINQNGAAAQAWAAPRRFFVPAFECPLETMQGIGARLLLQPPALQAGPRAAFEPVVVSPVDVKPLAEFIVMAVEAGRSDSLKRLQFDLRLSAPALWILP